MTRVLSYGRVSTWRKRYAGTAKPPRSCDLPGAWRNRFGRFRMEEGTTAMRVCTRCNEAKPETREFFGPDKRYAGGLTRWCRACKTAYTRERLSRPENAEKERERHRRAYAENPEKRREAVKKSYAKHAEKRRAERREYGIKHHEEELERGRRWRIQSYYVYLDIRNRRRARYYGVSYVKVTPEQYQAALVEWSGRCAFCGDPIHADNLVFDHILPLSKGGNHVPENLRPAHYSCNLKNNK